MFCKDLFILRLQTLRKEYHLNQSQLGELISISKQGVNEIEKGRASINIEKACILADYFDITIDYLVGRSDDPKRY